MSLLYHTPPDPCGSYRHRTICRTWHAFRLKNSSVAEAICWSTRNVSSLPHPKKIRSHLPLTIPCWYLCLATLKPHLILAGRSRPPYGQPCSSGSNRGSRSVTSHMITVCHMRRSSECCVPLSPLSGTGEHGSATWPVYHTQRLHGQIKDGAGPSCAPGSSGTPAGYHSRVEHTREALGPQTGVRLEG